MKKIILYIFTILCFSYNASAEAVDFTLLKTESKDLLGMSCIINDYIVNDTDKVKKFEYGIFDFELNNEGDIIYKEEEKSIWTIREEHSKGIITIDGKQKSIESNITIVLIGYDYLVATFGDNYSFIGIDNNTKKIALYENGNKAFENFKEIYAIEYVNSMLVYFGLDLDGKNFITINGIKKYTPNNYKIDDFNILNGKEYTTYIDIVNGKKNYYLYKEGTEIFSESELEWIDFSPLEDKSFYIKYKKNNGKYGLIINGDLYKEEYNFNPYKITHTSNGKYKIYEVQAVQFMHELYVNGKLYKSSEDQLLIQLGPKNNEAIFIDDNFIYRDRNDLLFRLDKRNIGLDYRAHGNHGNIEEIKYIGNHVYLLGFNSDGIIKKIKCNSDLKNIIFSTSEDLFIEAGSYDEIISEIDFLESKYSLSNISEIIDEKLARITGNNRFVFLYKVNELKNNSVTYSKYGVLLDYIELKLKLLLYPKSEN